MCINLWALNQSTDRAPQLRAVLTRRQAKRASSPAQILNSRS